MLTVFMIHTFPASTGTIVCDSVEETESAVRELLAGGDQVKFTIQKTQMTVEQRDSLCCRPRVSRFLCQAS